MKQLYIEHHVGSSKIEALGNVEEETEVVFRHNVHGSTPEVERFALAISCNPLITSLHFDSCFDYVAEFFDVLTERRCVHIKSIESCDIISDLTVRTSNTDTALQASLQRYFLVNRYLDNFTIHSRVPSSLNFLDGLLYLGTLSIDGSACPSMVSLHWPGTLEYLNITGVTGAHTEHIASLLAQFSGSITRLRLSLRSQLVRTEAVQVCQAISQTVGLRELEIGLPGETLWLCDMINEALMESESILALAFFEYSSTTNRQTRPLLQCCRSKLKDLALSSSCTESEVGEDDCFLSDLLLDNQLLEKVDLSRFNVNSSTAPDRILDLLPSMTNIKAFAFPKNSSVSFLNGRQLRKLLNVTQACPALTTLEYSAQNEESTYTVTLKQAVADRLEINKVRQSSFLRNAIPQLYPYAISRRRFNTVYFLLREKNAEIIPTSKPRRSCKQCHDSTPS